MSKALLSAALGAGGVSAYYNLPDFQTTIRSVLTSPHRPGPDGSDVQGLQRMVEQLAREIRRGNAVTIVNPGGTSTTGRANAAAWALVLLLAGAGYVRFVKGWQLTDLMYVTRGSLRSMEQQFTAGISDLQSRVLNVRRFIQEQVTKLTAKQDAAIAAQEEMKGQLGQVGRDVEGTRDQVTAVHDAVRALEGNLESLSGGLTYANQGIYVLCKVLGEIIGQGGGQAVKQRGALAELQDYVKNPPVLADRIPVAGLEQVLLGMGEGLPPAPAAAGRGGGDRPEVTGGRAAEDSRPRRLSSGLLIQSRPSIRLDSLGEEHPGA